MTEIALQPDEGAIMFLVTIAKFEEQMHIETRMEFVGDFDRGGDRIDHGDAGGDWSMLVFETEFE